jgi:hypothetical protein
MSGVLKLASYPLVAYRRSQYTGGGLLEYLKFEFSAILGLPMPTKTRVDLLEAHKGQEEWINTAIKLGPSSLKLFYYCK